MKSFPKLQKIFEAAVAKAAGESGMLLGQELAVSSFELEETTRDAFVKEMDDACLVAGVDSIGEYPGTFYLIFSLRDAIVMSGSLLGIPPARIAEKSKLAIMEADDLDAFAEILNQMTGSFKSVIQPLLPGFQLKLLPSRRFIPQDENHKPEEELAPEGDYVLLKTSLSISGKQLNSLHLLIPLQLAQRFDPPPPIMKEEPVAAPELQDDQQTKPLTATLLFLLDNDTEREAKMELFRNAGYAVLGGPVNANLYEFTNSAIDIVVLTVDSVDDRNLALTLKLKRLAEPPVPVIVSARQWTRNAVLKALKFGARDVLVEPVQPEELMAKVSRYMNAA